MSTADDAYYQQDCVRVMAEITKRLAQDINIKIEPQQAALDGATAMLAALDAGGGTAPADLQTKTDEYVQAVRDGYVAAKATADANLALSPEVQDALNIDAAAQQHHSDLAQEWIAAIDAAWTPGGP